MRLSLVLSSYLTICKAQARSFGNRFFVRSDAIEAIQTQHLSSVLQSPSEDCNVCIVEAPGGLSLVYWAPESTNETSISNENYKESKDEPYTVVDHGFTFTSPSVYVVYTSLQATYACNNGPITTLGSAYEKKTVGYSSSFLAYGTLSSPDQRCDENVVVGGFHTIDFSNLYFHPIIEATTTKEGCPPYVNPRLSMPADLTDVDPAWTTCQPLFYGAFDPPRILTKASGFGPQLPPSSPSKAATPVAAPEPTVTGDTQFSPTPSSATQGLRVPSIPVQTSTSVTPTPRPANPTDSAPIRGPSPSGLGVSTASTVNLGHQAPKVETYDSSMPQPSQIVPGTSPKSKPIPVGKAEPPSILHQSSTPGPNPSLPTTSSPGAPRRPPTEKVSAGSLPSPVTTPRPGADPVVVLLEGSRSGLDRGKVNGLSGNIVGSLGLVATANGRKAKSPIIFVLPSLHSKTGGTWPGSRSSAPGLSLQSENTNQAPQITMLAEQANGPLPDFMTDHFLKDLETVIAAGLSGLTTAKLSPDAFYTLSGTEHTGFPPKTITKEVEIPVSTAPASFSSSQTGLQQIFELNGQLLTQTRGVDDIHRHSTASNGQGELVMIALIKTDGNTSTRVSASAAQPSGPGTHANASFEGIREPGTTALLRATGGKSQTTTAPAPSQRTLVPVSSAAVGPWETWVLPIAVFVYLYIIL